MSIDRSKWKGWKELPTPLEGNTGKWKKYQSPHYLNDNSLTFFDYEKITRDFNYTFIDLTIPFK